MTWRRRLVLLLVVAAVSAPASAPAGERPAWDGSAHRLSPALRERMTGVSWHHGCPVHLRDLRLLRMPYVGFDGEVRRGRMVVYYRQAGKVLNIFERMYDAGFPIRRMKLIDAYDGSDARSMKANNTSAFNCRKIGGTNTWSQHAYGRAVDINPVQNPYVNDGNVAPAAGAKYLDRSNVRKGMIVRPGPVVRSFTIAKWHWGGDWHNSKDYQHFSRNGG